MLTPDHLPLLRAARNLIDEGREKFICLAVSEAATQMGDDMPDLEWQIRNYIEAEIAPHETLDEWLYAEMGAQRCMSSWSVGAAHHRTMHLARLAWLDRIITELENNHETADI